MTGWKIRIPLAAVLTMAAAWLGYRDGRAPDGGAGRAGDSTEAAAFPLKTDARDAAHAARESPAARLAKVRQGLGSARLSAGDNLELWQVIRGFTLDEVRASLSDLPYPSDREADTAQRSLLLFRWTQLDPETVARELLATKPLRESDINHVLTAWMRQDPDAAVKWAYASGSEQARRTADEMSAHLSATSVDPAATFARAAALSEHATDVTAYALGREMSRTAAGREQFLALIEDLPADRQSLAKNAVIGAWAKRDPAGAMADCTASFQGPEDQDALNKQSIILSSWQRQNPAAAMDWMGQSGNDFQMVARTDVYANWFSGVPGSALPWLLQQHDPDLVASAVQQSMAQLLRDRLMGNGESGNGPDPQTTAMQRQLDYWQQLQPEAAAAWQEKLPSSVQTRLANNPAAAK